MRARALILAVIAAAFVATPALPATKQAKPSRSAEQDEQTKRAREAFAAGTAAARAGQWSEALTHFEQADAIKPAPAVTFNIGVCQRALGRYVLARRSFERVLQDSEGLPKVQIEETQAYVEEIDRLLGRVRITLEPASARIAIDGRPLVPVSEEQPDVLVAGVAAAGQGKAPPKSVFEVIIDPGVHLIHASRPGHADVLLNKTFAPGTREELPLKLDELPATIHVESDQPRAVVMIDGRDVGLAPVDITRPAGRYRIQVQRKGFVGYESTIEVSPGQKANLRAALTPETVPITKRWWFWGGAAAVVAGGVTAAYFLTRPDHQAAPYDGGNLNWVAEPR